MSEKLRLHSVSSSLVQVLLQELTWCSIYIDTKLRHVLRVGSRPSEGI